WRQELEQKFVSDPGKSVTPQARIAVEKEIDSLRLQLERELSSGAHYLRHAKQEIETIRRKLRPELLKARQELAQAELNLEVANKRNPFAPILMALIIAFMIGILCKPTFPRGVGDGPYHPATGPESSSESARPYGDTHNPEAYSLYSQGARLSKEEKFRDAVK